MPSAVVFDTNAYQGLPGNLVDPLVAAEGARDILACADSWVIMELIAKLVAPESRQFARAALAKLWAHCGGDDLRIIMDCEEQVCRLLLGEPLPGHAATRDRMRKVVCQVASTPAGEDLEEEVLEAAEELRAHVTTEEGDRAALLMEGVLRKIVPDAQSWDAVARQPELRDQVIAWIDDGGAIKALAMSEVRRAHTDLGRPIPDPLPQELVDDVLELFVFPLEIESTAIRAVLERGADPTAGGRQNTLWDAQIAFNAGQSLDGGRKITLVTDDQLFHEVGQRIDHNFLLRLNEYLQSCGLAA